jgi:Bacterial regulatory helix-turn-helix proteins, AraC family
LINCICVLAEIFVEHIVILLELPVILWQRSFLRFFGRKLLFATNQRRVPKPSKTVASEELGLTENRNLLREYGAARPKLKRRSGGLPRKKLVRAVEYIQDQLDTDLTVSGIAQAVYMSPYHFMRLFKESTGQSPHQYVIEALG